MAKVKAIKKELSISLVFEYIIKKHMIIIIKIMEDTNAEIFEFKMFVIIVYSHCIY